MKEEIELYINENGIACVPLKMYNDSLGEIEKLNYIIDKQDRDIVALSNGNRKLKTRIDKAIELLSQDWYSVLRQETINKVKDILQGEKNE